MSDDSIRDSWDDKAADWSAWVGTEGDGNRRINSDPALWRLPGPVAGLDVLDAGCGTGYLTVKLAAAGARAFPARRILRPHRPCFCPPGGPERLDDGSVRYR